MEATSIVGDLCVAIALEVIFQENLSNMTREEWFHYEGWDTGLDAESLAEQELDDAAWNLTDPCPVVCLNDYGCCINNCHCPAGCCNDHYGTH